MNRLLLLMVVSLSLVGSFSSAYAQVGTILTTFDGTDGGGEAGARSAQPDHPVGSAGLERLHQFRATVHATCETTRRRRMDAAI